MEKETLVEFRSHGEDHLLMAIPLRDWFAGMAMQELIPLNCNHSFDDEDLDVSHLSRWAYTIADAMLAEREKARKG